MHVIENKVYYSLLTHFKKNVYFNTFYMILPEKYFTCFIYPFHKILDLPLSF